MSKELVDLRKKNLEQLNAELISARESQFGLRIKHKTCLLYTSDAADE